MGLTGWLARRVIAIAIFGPLLTLWYVVLLLVVRLPAGFLGLSAAPLAELVVAAMILALISDFLIVRAVKRAMKGAEGGVR